MVDSDDFADRFVTLPTLIMPVAAYRLACDLEARGFSLARDGDALVVSPHQRLTRADVGGLRRWRWHLLAYLDGQGRVFTDQRREVAPCLNR